METECEVYADRMRIAWELDEDRMLILCDCNATVCERYANVMRRYTKRMLILYERNATGYETYANGMRFYAKKSKAKKSKEKKSKEKKSK